MTKEQYHTTVTNFADNLFRYAVKSLRREADAKDVVQRSFEKLWLKHEGVDFAKVKSYLFTTAHNIIVDDYRKNKRMQSMADLPEKEIYSRPDGFELRDSLNNALQTLPDIQKRLVLLRDYEGYSYKEIGVITKLSEAQVKVYIFRARKKLQEILRRMERTGS